MLINTKHSLLLVVDLQTQLIPKIANKDSLLTNNIKLLQLSKQLDIPTLFTEQYPEGLGRTLPELSEIHCDNADVIEKVHFSTVREGKIFQYLKKYERSQIIICGAEAHVCVLQTALDLLSLKKEVFIVQDACGSRRPENTEAAIRRLEAAGAQIVTTEMVMFEWLERANNDTFREALPWIKL